MRRRVLAGCVSSLALVAMVSGCSAAAIPAPDVRLCIFVALFGTVLVEVRRRIGPF